MNDKIVRFKTRIFGGFDQRDVVSYLKSISTERNSLRREISALREHERELSDELARINTFELSDSVIDDAADILEKLETQHASIGEQISEIRRRFDAIRNDEN